MPLRIHAFQHVPFEALGSIETWAHQAGHWTSATRWFANDAPPSLNRIDWLIVMGGPMNIYEEARYPWLALEKCYIQEAIARGKVVLGICLGAQLVAGILGGKVRRHAQKEIGWFPIEWTPEASQSRVFAPIPSGLDAFHWHGDSFDIPPGALHVARSKACANRAFVYGERVIGLQFHLKFTEQSARLLIGHCQSELVDAPFIQKPEAMLADLSRFERINEVMAHFLTGLANRVGAPLV